MDFTESMKWAADNQVVFTVEHLDNIFLLRGQLDRIGSEYPFSTQEELASAMWTVSFAVQTGTKFHEENGFFPVRK